MLLMYRESSCTLMEAISRREPRHRQRGMSSDIDIADLKGAAFARGEVYGNMRRSQIERFLIAWLRSSGAAGVGNPQGNLSQMRQPAFRTPSMCTLRNFSRRSEASPPVRPEERLVNREDNPAIEKTI
jgi:hypothetical protein